jgi:hypothetical protein
MPISSLGVRWFRPLSTEAWQKRPGHVAGSAAFLGAMLVWLLAVQSVIEWTMHRFRN